MLDPKRKKPDTFSCYDEEIGCNRCTERGWRHAESWAEVEEYLAAGSLVIDNDGDPASFVIKPLPPDDGPEIYHQYQINTRSEHERTANQMRVENIDLVPPASPEEEADAMASIMEALKNTRLS